jgi:hypothetical protein
MTSLLAAALSLTLATAPKTAADFGAVATAPLPAGGLAMWGMGGYPEVRAGVRQGVRGFEIGASAGLDYLSTTAWGELGMRAPLMIDGPLRLSLDLGLGGFGDAGSRYQDPFNRPSAGLRFQVGSALTYKTPWPLALMASARIPVDVPLTKEGTLRVMGLLGAGVEVALTRDYYVILDGAFGPDLRHRSTGSNSAQLAVEAMVGVGYRVF